MIATNGFADILFSSTTGLRLRAGRLYADTQTDTTALLAEIRRSASHQAAQRDLMDYAPLPITRRDHSLPLTVLVRPGPAFSPLSRPLRRTAILVIRDPDQKATWPAPALARLFGLSTAEALLASELARGASLEEAAATLGISRNTVRTQLQTTFLKTGLNRQSDLIRALLNSAATSA